MIQIKLAPKYLKEGIEVYKNLVGYYRECEDPTCIELVPCPYVRCQEHRTDYYVIDNPIGSFNPKDVMII